MEEFKGTSGPWQKGEVGFGDILTVYCDDSFGSAVADCGCKYAINVTVEQAQANAQLVSAAPDLLKACQTFWELWQNSDMRPEDECHEVAAIIKLAIDKALNITESH